jgi:hypothetical protein
VFWRTRIAGGLATFGSLNICELTVIEKNKSPLIGGEKLRCLSHDSNIKKNGSACARFNGFWSVFVRQGQPTQHHRRMDQLRLCAFSTAFSWDAFSSKTKACVAASCGTRLFSLVFLATECGIKPDIADTIGTH